MRNPNRRGAADRVGNVNQRGGDLLVRIPGGVQVIRADFEGVIPFLAKNDVRPAGDPDGHLGLPGDIPRLDLLRRQAEDFGGYFAVIRGERVPTVYSSIPSPEAKGSSFFPPLFSFLNLSRSILPDVKSEMTDTTSART